MAKKNQKWIQKAVDRMEKKGTIGSFTEYCGGKVTAKCVEKALNSPDPKIRKKAQFYVNVVKKELGGLIRYANGGMVQTNQNETGLSETVGALNSIYGPTGAEALFDNAVQKADNFWNMHETAAKYGMRIYAKGGSVYLAEDGTEVPVQQTQPAQQPAQPSPSPQITYEQYVAFVTAYPEFLDRFLNELNQQLQNMEGSGQEQPGVEDQETEQPEMEGGGEIDGKVNPYDLINKTKAVSDDLYAMDIKNPNEFKEAFYQSVRKRIDPNIDRAIIDKIATDAMNSPKSDKIRVATGYLESWMMKDRKEQGGETIEDPPTKSSYDFMEGLRNLLYSVQDKNIDDIATEVNNYLIDNNVGIDYVTLKQNIQRAKEVSRGYKDTEMPLVFINTMGDMILKRYNQASEAMDKKKKGGMISNTYSPTYMQHGGEPPDELEKKIQDLEDSILEKAYLSESTQNRLKQIESFIKSEFPKEFHTIRPSRVLAEIIYSSYNESKPYFSGKHIPRNIVTQKVKDFMIENKMIPDDLVEDMKKADYYYIDKELSKDMKKYRDILQKGIDENKKADELNRYEVLERLKGNPSNIDRYVYDAVKEDIRNEVIDYLIENKKISKDLKDTDQKTVEIFYTDLMKYLLGNETYYPETKKHVSKLYDRIYEKGLLPVEKRKGYKKTTY